MKRQNGSITDNEWQYLLRSGAFVNPEDEENCPMPWLTGAKWALLCALEKTVPAFAGLTNDIKARPKVWQVKCHCVCAPPPPAAALHASPL